MPPSLPVHDVNLVVAAMVPFVVRYRPSFMLTLIERNRRIWQAVLGEAPATPKAI